MDPRGLIVFALLAAVVSGDGWSYEGDHGPEHWQHIGNNSCGGQHQSPINFTPDILKQDTTLGQFSITNFDNTTGIHWLMINNRHTVQITYIYNASENNLNVTGGGLPGKYQVAQFHFHWGSDSSKGSEHVVDGKAYPMELHVVTFNTKYPNTSEAAKNADGLAVLGFFFQIAPDKNPHMATLVSSFPNITEGDSHVDVAVCALSNFVSNMTHFYRYNGSLTTPGCNEVVTWTVFTTPINISETQMAEFRKLQSNGTADKIVDNFRPPQALNDRMVKTTFSPPPQITNPSTVYATDQPSTDQPSTDQPPTTPTSSAPVVFSTSAIACSLLMSVFGRL